MLKNKRRMSILLLLALIMELVVAIPGVSFASNIKASRKSSGIVKDLEILDKKDKYKS